MLHGLSQVYPIKFQTMIRPFLCYTIDMLNRISWSVHTWRHSWKCHPQQIVLLVSASVEGQIWGLSSLGKSEHSYGEMLVPILLGKLSSDIRRNLAREHPNSQWILAELLAAIFKEIRVLESGLHDLYSPTSRSSAASLLINSQDPLKKHRRDTDEKKKQYQCVFCQKNHSPQNCDTITDCQKRVDFVREHKLCYNCLAHHRVSRCPSKFWCRKCKKKHHTSLCSSYSHQLKLALPLLRRRVILRAHPQPLLVSFYHLHPA